MASVVPSSALLNARLTSEKLALEAQLREVMKEKRGLAQVNAALVDQVSTLEEAYGELKANLKRLFGGRGQLLGLAPGQELLFSESSDSGAGLTSAIEDLGQGDGEDIAELTGDDALVPDAEEARPAKKSKQRDRRKLAEADLQREFHRSEQPLDGRRCPVTGLELVEAGVKVTTELSYRKAELFLVEHHQVIYGPAPEIAQERTIEPLMSPAPDRRSRESGPRPHSLPGCCARNTSCTCRSTGRRTPSPAWVWRCRAGHFATG